MRYLKEYVNIEQYNRTKQSLELPNVSIIFMDTTRYNTHRTLYFKFHNNIKGTVSIKWPKTVTTMEYIKWSNDNGVTWNPLESVSEDSPMFITGEGKEIWICGNGTRTCPSYDDGRNENSINLLPNADCSVGGNVMSLLHGDQNFNEYNESVNYQFVNLFHGAKHIINAKELILPLTTLAEGCYSNMFMGCTSLVTAPELPATTLVKYCYHCMFQACTSMITAPELPATTLADYCYQQMFQGCRSLVTAPELPATTLANYCYYYMFNGCSSLVSAPELPATTLATNCYNGMFRGCRSLVTAPELPAITLANYCYSFMFDGCTSLNYIKCLATDISATDCTSGWVTGVASSGTFIKDPANVSWESGMSGIPEGWLTLTESEYQIYFKRFLTFEMLNAGSVTINNINNLTCEIYYSVDNGEWIEVIFDTNGQCKITNLRKGSHIRFKGENNTFYTSTTIDKKTINSCITFNSTADINIFGNIMSLIHGDNFRANRSFKENTSHIFHGLFAGLPIISAENLILPATTLVNNCYESMFQDCTSLATAPKLPATTLANSCYYRMFRNCTSLVTTPKLPATTLAEDCYHNMFRKCTSLITAPELPATTLAKYCYNAMFAECSNLTTAPELPATTLAESCYAYMFGDCSSLTTAPELPATTLAEGCYSQMFAECSNLTTAPELPATTLAESCYMSMFRNCTSLATASELPATTLANHCYYQMFRGCTSLVTAPELPATTLANYCYYQMFYGCASLNYIKALFLTTPHNHYTENWVSGVAESGTFVQNKNATWFMVGDNAIPENWVTTEYNEYINKYLTFEIVNSNPEITDLSSYNIELQFTYSYDGNSTYSPYNPITLSYLYFNADTYSGQDIDSYIKPTSDWETWTASNTSTRDMTVYYGDRIVFKAEPAYAYYAYHRDSYESQHIIDNTYHFALSRVMDKNPLRINIYGNVESLIYGDDFNSQYPELIDDTIDDNINDNTEEGKFIPRLSSRSLNSFNETNGLGDDNDMNTGSSDLDDSNLNKDTNGGISDQTTNDDQLGDEIDDEVTGGTSDKENDQTSEEAIGDNTGGGISDQTTNDDQSGDEIDDDDTNGTSMDYNPTQDQLVEGEYRRYGELFRYLPIQSAKNMIIPPINLHGEKEVYKPILPKENEDTRPYQCAYMFANNKYITHAPFLSASYLTSDCYHYMFNGCTSLNYVKAMFTTTPASNITNQWMGGTYSSTDSNSSYIFIKNKDALWTNRGDDSIQNGWTVYTMPRS